MRPFYLLALAAALPLSAQTDPAKLPLESPEPAVRNPAPPAGSGYRTDKLVGCRVPETPCGVITGGGGDRAAHRQVLQSLDAADYRGQQIRYGAWLKLESPKLSSAALFVRVERPSGVGLLRYDLKDPIRSRDWERREILGRIDEDATRIVIGLDFSGLGSVQFSEPEFEIVKAE